LDKCLASLGDLTQKQRDLDTAESCGQGPAALADDPEDVISVDAAGLPGDTSPSNELPDDPVMSTGVVGMYLALLKEQLNREMDMDPWPKCYKQGQFWIYPPDPYFLMHKGLQKGLSPDPLYHPVVFLWLPHLLDKQGILCSIPGCQNYRNPLVPLTIKGWNSDPIAWCVVALDSCYFVMTKHIQCYKGTGGCGHSWNLYDPIILEQLEPGLAAHFPAFLTHRSGIDKILMTLIRAGMAHQVSSSAWADILQELNLHQHDL
jgi:hypothetical protein